MPLVKLSQRDFVTTTEAARLCRVGSNTIRAACDEGELSHFLPPRSKCRRVLLVNLMGWAIAKKLPTDLIRGAMDAAKENAS